MSHIVISGDFLSENVLVLVLTTLFLIVLLWLREVLLATAPALLSSLLFTTRRALLIFNGSERFAHPVHPDEKITSTTPSHKGISSVPLLVLVSNKFFVVSLSPTVSIKIPANGMPCIRRLPLLSDVAESNALEGEGVTSLGVKVVKKTSDVEILLGLEDSRVEL
jgi:hypothetical protein